MTKIKWKEQASELVKKNEGLRLRLYKCPAGKLTIGYGHNIEDNGINNACAEFIFNEDLSNCIRVAEEIFGKTFFGNLKDNAKVVIVDMLFNLGSTKFLTFKKFIRCVKNYDYEGAGNEIVNSKAYKQNTRRYKELSKLIKE